MPPRRLASTPSAAARLALARDRPWAGLPVRSWPPDSHGVCVGRRSGGQASPDSHGMGIRVADWGLRDSPWRRRASPGVGFTSGVNRGYSWRSRCHVHTWCESGGSAGARCPTVQRPDSCNADHRQIHIACASDGRVRAGVAGFTRGGNPGGRMARRRLSGRRIHMPRESGAIRGRGRCRAHTWCESGG